MMRCFILTIALLCSIVLSGQIAQVVAFTADQIGSRVLLAFTFGKGSTCNDTQIQRADTSLQFTTIGRILGVCGSVDREESYTYVDSFPSHGEVNHYRISLAGLGYSDTIALDVVPISDDALLLFPNPADYVLGYSIGVNTSGQHVITITDEQGRLVLEMTNTGYHGSASVAHLQAGAYSVKVRLDDGQLIASFIKL